MASRSSQQLGAAPASSDDSPKRNLSSESISNSQQRGTSPSDIQNHRAGTSGGEEEDPFASIDELLQTELSNGLADIEQEQVNIVKRREEERRKRIEEEEALQEEERRKEREAEERKRQEEEERKRREEEERKKREEEERLRKEEEERLRREEEERLRREEEERLRREEEERLRREEEERLRKEEEERLRREEEERVRLDEENKRRIEEEEMKRRIEEEENKRRIEEEEKKRIDEDNSRIAAAKKNDEMGEEEKKRREAEDVEGRRNAVRGQVVIALYPYQGDGKKTLSMARGDRFIFIKPVNEKWSLGKKDGVQALFPLPYVRVLPEFDPMELSFSDSSEDLAKLAAGGGGSGAAKSSCEGSQYVGEDGEEEGKASEAGGDGEGGGKASEAGGEDEEEENGKDIDEKKLEVGGRDRSHSTLLAETDDLSLVSVSSLPQADESEKPPEKPEREKSSSKLERLDAERLEKSASETDVSPNNTLSSRDLNSEGNDNDLESERTDTMSGTLGC